MTALHLDPDRLFPADPRTRDVARALHSHIRDLPILSPHGHCDPAWFATDAPFDNPAALMIQPDHYVLRMLHSQGVPLEALGIPRRDGGEVERDPRAVWRLFARHYPLFRGTPTRLWHDWVHAGIFGLTERLDAETADDAYDTIEAALKTASLRPRALFDRFRIEVLATTEGPLDPLDSHAAIAASGWQGRAITTYRPDAVTDPDHPEFAAALERFGALTGCDVATWAGYLDAHRDRRAFFRRHGATATDHGHPTATTLDLSRSEAEAVFARVVSGRMQAGDAEAFRGQVLTEMARMSLDDGMVLQIHPGVHRNHDPRLFAHFGSDRGGDIPVRTDYVTALKPLLNRFGSEPGLSLIVFTLDETTYARELAPLAGYYPALRLGAPWWFHDSPEGMRRFREQVTGTAGFYNTVGFTDDTRAFLSIPARHDVARRMDCGWLAQLVVEGRLEEDEAYEVAHALTRDLVKAAYRL